MKILDEVTGRRQVVDCPAVPAGIKVCQQRVCFRRLATRASLSSQSSPAAFTYLRTCDECSSATPSSNSVLMGALCPSNQPCKHWREQVVAAPRPPACTFWRPFSFAVCLFFLRSTSLLLFTLYALLGTFCFCLCVRLHHRETCAKF